MFTNQQVFSVIVISFSLISTYLSSLYSSVTAQPTPNDIAQIQIQQTKFKEELYTLKTRIMGIPFDDFSVQTLAKVVDGSKCLSGNEADYFSTQTSISRTDFSFLFSRCFRYLINRYPHGIFGRNDLTLQETENIRELVNGLKPSLKTISKEFAKELILADEDLFSDTIAGQRFLAISGQKFLYLKENIDYMSRVNPDITEKELKLVISLTQLVQCFPKDLNSSRYIPKNIDNLNLSRLEVGYILSSCFDRVNEIIDEKPNDIPFTKNDLLLMQTLQEQFVAEMANLKGRCDLSIFRSYILGYGCV